MTEDQIIYTDPEELLGKIDWEGWPSALEWFVTDRFEDTTLDRLVQEAYGVYRNLETYRNEIEDRLDLLVDNNG